MSPVKVKVTGQIYIWYEWEALVTGNLRVKTEGFIWDG